MFGLHLINGQYEMYLDTDEGQWMQRRADGTYEGRKSGIVRRYLHPGDTFWDIGANKGWFTLLAASIVGPTGRVVAFEPIPENMEWVEKSVDVNGWGDRVQRHKWAITGVESQLTMFYGVRSGGASLLQSKGTVNKKRRVRGRTIDAICNRRSRWPNMIKMDIEGAELDALRGGAATFRAMKRIMLLIDVHAMHGVQVADVLNLLKELKFKCTTEQGEAFSPFMKRANRPASIVAVKGMKFDG